MHTLQLLGHMAKALVCGSTASATKAGVAVANHRRLHEQFKNIVDVKNQTYSVRLKTTEEWSPKRIAELGPKNAAEQFLERLQQRSAHESIAERIRTSALLQDALQRQCMRAALPKQQAAIESMRGRCVRYQDRLEQLSQARLDYCEQQEIMKAIAKLDAAIAPHDSPRK